MWNNIEIQSWSNPRFKNGSTDRSFLLRFQFKFHRFIQEYAPGVWSVLSCKSTAYNSLFNLQIFLIRIFAYFQFVFKRNSIILVANILSKCMPFIMLPSFISVLYGRISVFIYLKITQMVILSSFREGLHILQSLQSLI